MQIEVWVAEPEASVPELPTFCITNVQAQPGEGRCRRGGLSRKTPDVPVQTDGV